MRLPWQRKPESVDPHRPHAYRPKSDAGVGALAPTGGALGPGLGDLAATSAYTRTLGCAVPGCGKLSDDLIHAPED